MRILIFVTPALAISGVFVVPELQLLRPGILDGLLTGLLGVLAGWMAGEYGAERLEQTLIAQIQGKKWQSILGICRHDLVQMMFFIALAVSSTFVGFGLHSIGLSWPVVGKDPTVIAGIAAFFGSIYYRFAKWYDNLPD